jgi:nucleotide-binding universal stress UspA family protein
MFPTRILVATDFSPCSKRAVETAAELAVSTKAEVVLLHAFQFPVLSFLDGAYFPSSDEVAKLTHAAQDALADVSAELGARGITTKTVLRDGNPAEEVASQAKELGCDLVVVGTHGRSAMGRALLGSVAHNVIRLSPVPVVTVRQE